jgi:predicted GNAT family acetyltransferase
MSDVKDNPQASRFEMAEAGQLVFADYRRQGSQVFIDHVEAPVALRGSGASGRFMEGLVEVARREHLTLVPICSYAVHWLSRHPEARDVTGA